MTTPLLQPINESRAWNSVLSRDKESDGTFIYAVVTTGIYCRPSCPSRRPNRENVKFFPSVAVAEREGFRACHRCRPGSGSESIAAVQRARAFIDRSITEFGDERLTLERIAREAGLSPHHLHRRFKDVVGLTPAEYGRARRSEKLKKELRRGESVSRATYGAGYGSSSRVYESADAQLGMTPATYQRGGAGAQIEYVVEKTSLGYLLVAATARGVCAVTLGDEPHTLEASLAKEYPAAVRQRVGAADSLVLNGAPSSQLAAWVSDIVASVEGRRAESKLPLDLQATAFQWRVWRELQKIPVGETRSYSEIAAAIGSPKAVRAVASACAKNRVALVIPCHRVLRRGGGLGGYRWGVERKRQLIEKESNSPKAGSS
jgi:AraC family transcriptional regulator, regulatory protein of adaptative response / methylated-DNA-[protein]-cysteine methyltransferase